MICRRRRLAAPKERWDWHLSERGDSTLIPNGMTLRNIEAAPEDFCFIVDDTDNPKSSMKAYYSGLWRSSKGVYWGQRVTVLALLHIPTGSAIPLSYRLGQKGEDPQAQSGIDYVSDMIEEILAEGFPKIRLVADSWFDATKLAFRMHGAPRQWFAMANAQFSGSI